MLEEADGGGAVVLHLVLDTAEDIAGIMSPGDSRVPSEEEGIKECFPAPPARSDAPVLCDDCVLGRYLRLPFFVRFCSGRLNEERETYFLVWLFLTWVPLLL